MLSQLTVGNIWSRAIVDVPDAVKNVVKKATMTLRYHCHICNVSALNEGSLEKHIASEFACAENGVFDSN